MRSQEVRKYVDCIARRLIELGLSPDGTVGVCCCRSRDAAVAAMGVLEAGAAWLPLDHDVPDARMRRAVEDAGARALLVDAEIAERLPPFAHPVVVLELRMEDGAPVVERAGAGRLVSFAQQRLWFFAELDPRNAAYNVPVAVRIGGPLDVGVLERSLVEIARRHEALRTTFQAARGRPVRVVRGEPDLAIARVDLRHLPGVERAAEARRLLEEEARRPFDLAAGPLVRALAVTTGDDEHALLVVMHHIVSDGWSAGILFRELAALYPAFASGLPSPLPPPKGQDGDQAAWQHRTLRGALLEEEIAWWCRALSGLPGAIELPTTFARPAAPRHRGASAQASIPGDAWRRLVALARAEGATPFMAILAAYAVLLHRHSGQDDLAIGTPVAGRTRPEIEGAIGFFVNTIAVRVDLSGEPTSRDLMARVKASALGAIAHQELPFDKLVEALHPPREQGRPPLVQVLLAFQSAAAAAIELGDLRVDPLAIETGTSVFDLSLSAEEIASGLALRLRYDADLFDAAAAARILSQLAVLVAGMARDPDAPVGRLAWLRPEERAQLLDDWSSRPVARDLERSVHELFAEHARRAPDHAALAHAGGTIRYGELLRWSYAIARALRAAGVGIEVPVGVHAERSPELVAGVLGVMFAGGAAVPLDPAIPRDRLLGMIDDARPKVVLSRAGLEGSPARELRFADVDGRAEAPPEARLTPENLAYIVFTSGSTGRPKGVMIEHRGFTNLVLDQADRYAIDATSRVLQFFAPSFDGALSEIFLALSAGATLVLPPPEALLSGAALVALLAAERVTFAKITPSMLRELPDAALPDLAGIGSAGEALTGDLVARWSRGRRFFNGYGPTEATVGASVMDCTGLRDPRPPIGRPWANKILYVLDRFMEPVPIGVPGELYVGGVGIARGYVGRPDLTAERFLDDPFRPGGRVYRTGDRAAFLPDGNLAFIGRVDDQVKIRGYRVEPGEIEAALAQHAAVAAAAVVLRSDGGEPRLVAYVAPRSAPAPESDELIRHLRARVPDYMLPAAIVTIDALPKTANGKIDKAKLPAPLPGVGRTGHVAPRDELEAKVAAVWEQVLDVRPIGLRDGFFELGGHSLLAVRLLNRLHDALGREIPLSAFFQRATVEGVCDLLRRDAASADPSGAPPFFCVHPLGGVTLCYASLSRAVAPDLPFHALAAREPLDNIESMAEAHLVEVRRAQPRGPYRLGGWSMGGLVALEMARRLSAKGEEVEAVILMDSHPSDPWTDEPGDGLLLAMALGFAVDPRASFEEASSQAAARGLFGERDTEASARQIVQIARSHLAASRAYRAAPLDVPVTLLWAAERWAGDRTSPPDAWAPFCPRLSHARVNGNHRTMLEGPHAREIGARVVSCFQRSR